MDITLLKLGGSLITDKSKPYTARPDIIRQILEELSDILKKNPDQHFIIGHGAGSFAHQSAKKYNTINGFTDSTGAIGASIVHADAMKLHQIVLDECAQLELPVFSLQPSAFILAKNKEFLHADFSILKQSLNNGLTPIIFGDVLVDSQIGATIFSTDKLFSVLVNHFMNDEYKIKKIIHAGYFDGVLNSKNTVIPEITSENFPEIKQQIGNSEHIDVTGGMLKKVEESLEIAGKGILSHIINGSKKGNISKALNNDYSFGTCILNK